MLTPHERDVVVRAKKIYEDRLRSQLELKCAGDFVAIEPESGDYFVASTMREADSAAKSRYPGRLTYVARIGHTAVFHMGAAR